MKAKHIIKEEQLPGGITVTETKKHGKVKPSSQISVKYEYNNESNTEQEVIAKLAEFFTKKIKQKKNPNIC